MTRSLHSQSSTLSELDAHCLGVCPCPFQEEEEGVAATFCGRTNKNIKNKSIQSRLDRIYIKILRNTLKVHFYGLTGTLTQPSDHFGVFSQIDI